MKRIVNTLKINIKSFLEFIYPPYCICCKTPTPNKSHICKECYAIIIASGTDTLFQTETIKNHLSLYDFNNQTRAAIHALKYNNMVKPANSILLSGIRNSQNFPKLHFDTIEPVPLHWYRQIRRGYNQAQHLAETVSKESGIPLSNFLKRKKYTFSQTKKNRFKRQKSVKGSFDLKSQNCKPTKKSILLIDDVFTTGATAVACSRVLLAHGAKEVSLLTVASVSPDDN